MLLDQKSIGIFWSKIEIKNTEDCWNWLAGLFSSGYGSFTADHKTYRTHRVAWELTNGPITEDRLILHKCDNKKCCNPNHLYCGTYGDNQHDRNERHPISASSSGSGKTKLYEGEVWLIRKLCREGKSTLSQKKISKMFKVSNTTINRIAHSTYYLCKEGRYI